MYKVSEIFRAPARRAFLDGNPGHTQMPFHKDDPEREPLDEFEWRFTVGYNVGTANSPIPCSGLSWHRLPRPVHLPMWPVRARGNGRFTTISTWTGRGTDCIAAVNADYESHAQAARAIAEEYFDADRVLKRILDIVID
jgi:hypothetical protein